MQMSTGMLVMALRLCFLGLCLLACGESNFALAQTDQCKVESKLEVLPGRGWDNLRNKEMGQVLSLSYSRCKSTEDGQYLLPDHVSAIPIKKSDLALTSELIEHYSNYCSITSKSFKAEASGSHFGVATVSGSFSSDYETVKKHQVDDKSVTTRVHIRNTVYSVLAEPSADVDPDLKKQLLTVAQEIGKNNTDKAQFLLELIVRDYGTHYITQVDAGAILAKEDFISDKFAESFSGEKNKLCAAASASFLGEFSFDTSYSSSVDTEMTKKFKDSRTASYVRVYGGSLLEPNLTVHQWVSKIPNNLVATDRSGEPLSYILTPTKFPDIYLSVLGRLRLLLDGAIRSYYSHNTRVGCMSMDSTNFDYNANVDSHKCHSAYNNYTFGGVYQTCKVVRHPWFYNGKKFCDSSKLMNPLTGKQSCPPGYKAVPLVSDRDQVQTCFKVWFWWECAVIEYDSFWCMAADPVSENQGLMFGGVFSDTTINLVTQSQSCPFTFFPLYIGTRLKVCVSSDYELGFKYSVPFGGFFSCMQGNPLAVANKTVSHYYGGGAKNVYPHGCPGGYSQHMAIIDNNCEIYFCAKANAFDIHGQIPIFRPPFKDLSSLYVDKMSTLSLSAGVTSMSGGNIAGIVIGSLMAIAVVVLGLVWWRRQRNNNRVYRGTEQDPLLPERSHYQTVDEPDNSSAHV